MERTANQACAPSFYFRGEKYATKRFGKESRAERGKLRHPSLLLIRY
jgi:hypothetical protein